MKALPEEAKNKVLELLRLQRSQQEISDRTGVCIGTIQDWAAGWRKEGTLAEYSQAGSAYVARAQSMSNGFYKCIRKRYNGMRWTDKLNGRQFGFSSPTQVIHYYLKDGRPRPCAYCGRYPVGGKVWGLDRIDSSIGHVPGNLVPCCSSHLESSQLSCQASKSKFSLLYWMESSMSRANGGPVPFRVVEQRLERIYTLARELKELELGSFEPEKEI